MAARPSSPEQQSLAIDRTGWTETQYVEDAQRLLRRGDTSIRCFTLEHVYALSTRLQRLELAALLSVNQLNEALDR